jgi:hypothetical protein
MNKGSKRITVRVGDELLEEMRACVERLNSNPTAAREWSVTEFVIQAIVEKIKHGRRSRNLDASVSCEKIDPYQPREFEAVPESELTCE